MGIFAQGWTVDGYVSLGRINWDEGRTTNQTSLSLSVIVGRYITDSLNIGLSGGFGLGMGSNTDTGYRFSVGPRVKYDLLHFERAYLSVLGGVYYYRFSKYFTYGNNVQNEAQRVLASVMPAVNFQLNEMIEVYWQFAEIYYQYTWFDNSQTRTPTKISQVGVSGPFSNPSFGLIFNF
jgi:hypothetical protein